MKTEPTVLSLNCVTEMPVPDSCDVRRDYVVVMACDRMREEDGGENASIMRRLRQFAGEKARGACPDMLLEEEPTPMWSMDCDQLGTGMTLKIRYEIRPSVHQKFISPEAKADAGQIESVVDYSDLSAMQPVRNEFMVACPTCKGDILEGDQAVGITVDNWTKYYHPRCVPAVHQIPASASNALPIPQTVNATTGNEASKGEENPWAVTIPWSRKDRDPNYIPLADLLAHMDRGARNMILGRTPTEPVYHPHDPRMAGKSAAPVDFPCNVESCGCDEAKEFRRSAAEDISVKWQKRDDLDAAMTKECRAALAKLREWPRCKDHDAPMAVKCCLPFSGNGKRYVFAGCPHEGCGRTSSPVEIELSGPTARAIDGESWTAQEFRT